MVLSQHTETEHKMIVSVQDNGNVGLKGQVWCFRGLVLALF